MRSCRDLWDNLKDHQITAQLIQFDDLYSSNLNKQKAVTQLYSQLLEQRDKIMKSASQAKREDHEHSASGAERQYHEQLASGAERQYHEQSAS